MRKLSLPPRFRRLILPAAAVLLVLARLWLIMGEQLIAYGIYTYDDALFVRQAANILQGHWLGPYDSMTLIKGPFYPLFIAGSFLSGLPLLFTQHLFYLLACGLFVWSVRPLIKKDWLAMVLFALLIFNPASYDVNVANRVLREYIYTSLTLIVLACLVELIAWRCGRLRGLLGWSVGLGLAFFSFWITREEGVWLLPVAVCAYLWIGLSYWRFERPDRLGLRALILVLPLALFGLGLMGLSAVNYANYGLWGITEMNDATFTRAFGAMARIQAGPWYPDVPVTAEARMAAYPYSASLAKLQGFLEGEGGRKWLGADHYSTPGKNEISGGGNVWAFREAVADAGYYANGKYPADFYRRVASEIDAACRAGTLRCTAARASLQQPFDRRQIPLLAASVEKIVPYLLTFDGMTIGRAFQSNGSEWFTLFEDITRQNIANRATYTLSGWAVQPGRDLSFQVLDGQGRPAPSTTVRIKVRLDADAALQGLSIDPGGKKATGFEIQTNCSARCSLVVLSGYESQAEMDLFQISPGKPLSLKEGGTLLVEQFERTRESSLSTSDLWNRRKGIVLNAIGQVYRWVSPVAFVLALVGMAFLLIRAARQKRSDTLLVLLALLLLLVALRIGLIGLIDATAFRSIRTGYLAPAYPALIAFDILVFVRMREKLF